MTNKKILVVCQHFWPESFRINDICDYFTEQGHDVDVLCGIPNYPKGEFFSGYSYFKNRKQTHEKIHIRRAFEIPRGNNTNIRIFINYISFPIASLFHIPRLLTKKYDKILLYQLSPVMMSITGILVGRLKKIETTMYVLDLWPENLFSVLPIKNRLAKKLVTSMSHWHYKKVDKLVVLSNIMKERLVEIPGVEPGKVIVLPQACEKIYESNLSDPNLIKKFRGGFNLVFAGNISPAQSFETILDAAEHLQNDGIKDIRWIIVGDGMSRKWLEKTVKERDLNNFFFEGHKPVEDVPKYTNIADGLIGCLVKSELLEATIPAKVMSYIAAGKPMILAMDGEVQDLINKIIKCGYASNAGDSEAFYKNVAKLYNTKAEERQAMGQRSKKYHMENFQRNIILNKLHAFMFNT